MTTLLGPDCFSGIIGSFVGLTVVAVDLIVVVNAVAVLSYVYNVIWLKRNTHSINYNWQVKQQGYVAFV